MNSNKHLLKISLLTGLLLLASNLQAVLPGLSSRDGIPTLAPILEKALPAIVNIEVQATMKAQRNTPFPFPFDEFFNNPEQRQPDRQRRGTGSGVIIDAQKGLLITNNHVVAQAETIFVKLQDGNRYQAEIVGSDSGTDIAILKIEADNLIGIPIGDSEKLKVGDFVIAIGNPFGLNHSVTSGIVSALSRSNLGIGSYEDFIQTDASINPGNSGGALINLKGELVGINTAILGPSGGNIGIGFAIPINMVTDISEQILEHGEVRRGLLGVIVQTLTPDLKDAFGIDQEQGAIISEVEPGSAADKAELKAGDIVLSVNGKTIESASDMRNFIGLLRSDTKISIKILRDKQEKIVVATITERKKTVAEGGKFSPQLKGTLLREVDEETQPYEEAGILIQEIKRRSVAFYHGLRKGDLILTVNNQRVKDLDGLEDALGGDQTLLNVQRGKRRLFLVLK